MKQFDVFDNPFPGSTGNEPFLVLLQSDLFNSLPVAVVAPLTRFSAVRSMDRSTPLVEFNGERLLVIVWNIASISRGMLGPPIGSLEEHRYRIVGALDLLFTGV